MRTEKEIREKIVELLEKERRCFHGADAPLAFLIEAQKERQRLRWQREILEWFVGPGQREEIPLK